MIEKKVRTAYPTDWF